MLSGFDVSHYQGRRRLDGARFVIAKATEGLTYKDPLHGWFRDEAKRVGAVFGSYHFGHPDNAPEAEARFFLETARPRPGELVALDLEVNDGLPPSRVAAYARTWLDYVARRTSASPLLYTYRHFAQAGNCAGCGGYPLWIADPGRPAGQPRVPSPWDHWTIHQYSTAGDIDHDVANVHDIAQLRKLAVPDPEEEDMPSASEIAEAVWQWDHVPDTSSKTNVRPVSMLTNIEDTQDKMVARLAAMQKTLADVAKKSGVTVDVDEVALARELLTALTPGAIADAVVDGIGAELARRVVDELSARLGTPS